MNDVRGMRKCVKFIFSSMPEDNRCVPGRTPRWQYHNVILHRDVHQESHIDYLLLFRFKNNVDFLSISDWNVDPIDHLTILELGFIFENHLRF